MKTKLKAFILAGSLLFVLLGLLISIPLYNNYKVQQIEETVYPITVDFDEVDRNYRTGVLAYDYTDKAKHVGFMDNVFVGRVDRIIGTSYSNVSIKSGKVSATSWTNYEVTVLGNIKGNLKIGISLPIKKWAGLDFNTEYLTINYGDIMPKEGYYYIFCAFVDETGELYVSCNDANIELGNECDKAIEIAFSSKSKTDIKDTVANLIWEYFEAEAKKDTSVKKNGESYTINQEYVEISNEKN